MTKYAKYGEDFLSAVKYFIAAVTILGGVLVTISPIVPLDGALGFLYGTRWGLILFGIFTALCGAVLLIGKIRHSRKWTGIGLMSCYLCFFFATLLQIAAFSNISYWIFNAILCVITGALWLRWKFKTAYINPNHFKQDIIELQE